MLRRDKTTGMEPYEYWASPVEQVYYEPLVYQWYDPDYYELTPNQRDYTRNYMESFDEMMSGPDFADPETGYPAWIDTQSFIDMLIINEFSKGLDCYMFSTYFYKENDEDGGKLYAGPPWDYNISMDNVNYGYDQDIPFVLVLTCACAFAILIVLVLTCACAFAPLIILVLTCVYASAPLIILVLTCASASLIVLVLTCAYASLRETPLRETPLRETPLREKENPGAGAPGLYHHKRLTTPFALTTN